MLFGEEDFVSWPSLLKYSIGALIGLVPAVLLFARKWRSEAPQIAAKKQRVRAKDESLEQAIYDHRFGWYKEALEGLQARVDSFEKDRVAYLSDNATLKERCENQLTRINELLKINAEQQKRMTELTDEVDQLRSRVQELESQVGGV